jgi:hypothetical protein
MKFGKTVAAAAVAACFTLLGSPAARANVILTYTGNDFNSFSAGQTTYTTADKVTASINLASPLGDDHPFFTVTPLAFSISDGVQTLTNKTPGVGDVFVFETNSTGVITFWDFHAGVGATSTVGSVNLLFPPGEVFDFGNMTLPTIGFQQGAVHGDPGSFIATTVPEPPTVSLLGGGLLSLSLLWLRRRRSLDLAQVS